MLLDDMPNDTRVSQVKLLVSPVVSNWRCFYNDVEWFFSGFRQSDRVFESMMTHFAVEVRFDDGLVAILERTVAGVACTERSYTESEYESGEPDHHNITVEDVMRFYTEQSAQQYCPGLANCKYFAYHFMANVFHRRQLGYVGSWCRSLEVEYEVLSRRDI